jgi:UDP-N-acetylmuramoylalanine--D-glutamate ligase
MDLTGKRVYVIGLGAYGTGSAVARVAQARGACVTVADQKTEAELAARIEELAGRPIIFELGERAYAGLLRADMVVVSPGVPPEIEPLQRARAQGIPVIGEIELAYRLSTAPIIAIAGTKGKTTTTSLIAALLTGAGVTARVGGNIGAPLIEQAVVAAPDEYLVAEVSSFQLETIDQFRPKAAVFLNFHPDHLDRHGTLDAYWQAKLRIFENQRASDFAVLNFGDPKLQALAPSLRARVISYASAADAETDACLRDGRLCISRALDGAGAGAGECRPVFPASELRLVGRHNVENALAALATVAALGVSLNEAAATLRTFTPIPNRLEDVATVKGVTFINDSQATTPAPVLAALDAMEGPVALIAGGRAKGADLGELAGAIARRVDHLVTIGEAGPEIAARATAAGARSVERAESMAEAVEAAYRHVAAGGVVLLSPACASFDMFEGMAQRGEAFRQAVRALQEREEKSA